MPVTTSTPPLPVLAPPPVPFPWRPPVLFVPAISGSWSTTSVFFVWTVSPIFTLKKKLFYISKNLTETPKIVTAFRGMHVSHVKHSYAWLSRKCDYLTDRHTDIQTPDKVIPMCCYASQATQNDLYFNRQFSTPSNPQKRKACNLVNSKKSRCVCETLTMPPSATKSKKAIFRAKVKSRSQGHLKGHH